MSSFLVMAGEKSLSLVSLSFCQSFQQVLPAELGRDVHTQLVFYTLKSKRKTRTASWPWVSILLHQVHVDLPTFLVFVTLKLVPVEWKSHTGAAICTLKCSAHNLQKASQFTGPPGHLHNSPLCPQRTSSVCPGCCLENKNSSRLVVQQDGGLGGWVG